MNYLNLFFMNVFIREKELLGLTAMYIVLFNQ